MATLTARLPLNVTGLFYVDDSCIDCDLCRTTAPDFFRRDDELGMSYVYRQPDTPESIAVAESALDGCPVTAIGP